MTADDNKKAFSIGFDNIGWLDGQPPREPVEGDAAAYRAFWEEWHRRGLEA